MEKNLDSRHLRTVYDQQGLREKKSTVDPQPSQKYNYGGAFTLVDGRTGLLPWKGTDWLGFSGTNMNALIDLEKKTSFTQIRVEVLDD
jgi:hexosaminidase